MYDFSPVIIKWYLYAKFNLTSRNKVFSIIEYAILTTLVAQWLILRTLNEEVPGLLSGRTDFGNDLSKFNFLSKRPETVRKLWTILVKTVRYTFWHKSGINLEPVLFLVFINDFTQFYFSPTMWNSWPIKSALDCHILQRDIIAMSKWSVKNKLLFNNGKYEIMSFSRSPSPLRYDYLLAGGAMVLVREVRDLGVTFDASLTFWTHARNVAKCAYRGLGRIRVA